MRGNLAQLCDSSNDWLKSVMTDDEQPIAAEQLQSPAAVPAEATLVMADEVSVNDPLTLPDIQARPSSIAAPSATAIPDGKTPADRRATLFARAKANFLVHRKLMIAGGLGCSLLIGGVLLAVRRPDGDVLVKAAIDQTQPSDGTKSTPAKVPATDGTTGQTQPPADPLPPTNTSVAGGAQAPATTDGEMSPQPPTDFVPVPTDDTLPPQIPTDLVPVPTENVAPVPPSAASAQAISSMLGVATTTLEPITASGHMFRGGAMVTVVEADASAPGDDLRLQLDDVITKVGDVEIHHQADLERALASASPKLVVQLEIQRYPRSWLREKLGVKPANADEEAQRRRDVLLARALGENTEGFARTLTIELTLGNVGQVSKAP